MKPAHRAAYELLVGPIPTGKQIHHICKNRACINPSHLQVVTPKEHVWEENAGNGGQKKRQTHCIHGHEFTPENTIWEGDNRHCKKCHAEVTLRSYYKLTPEQRRRRNDLRNARRAGKPRSERDKRASPPP